MQVPLIGLSILPIIKVFVLIASGIYIIFSLVIIKQVQLMTDTIEVGFEIPLRIIAIGHFVFAALVFLLAITLL